MKRMPNLLIMRMLLLLNLTTCIAYEIRQGTIEQKEADREWVLAHYSRTAKKRSLLSAPAPRPTSAATEQEPEPEKKRQRR